MDRAGPECTGLAEPEALAIARPCVGFAVADADHIYWTEHCEGRVMKVSASGGEPVVVADGQLHPAALALDERYLYWTNLGSGGSKDGTVVRMVKAGGPITVLAAAQKLPWRLAIYGPRVYWTNLFAAAPVMSVRKDGSEPPDLVAEGGQHARGIAVDVSGVYWADFDQGAILRCPLAGCEQAPVLVAEDQLTAISVRLDDSRVYWARNGGGLLAVPKDGGGPATQIHTGFSGGIRELVIDENSLFWTEGSTVMTMPKSGGTASIVAESEPIPEGLAVHGTCVYYTSFLDGGVFRVEKP